MSSWNDQNIVNNYSDAADNPEKNWYEDEVNIPSILTLLPGTNVRILDFGCGPGDLTYLLSSHFSVVGADSASNMIEKAKAKYPGISFIVWDGLSKLAENQLPFDAIVTKLTLEFIENLPAIAENFYGALTPNGTIIISVQHPLLAISMHPEQDLPYWSMPKFEVQIGTTGITVTKMHRNFRQYIEPFQDAGFTLTKIDEPGIPPEVASLHGASELDLKFPKRLNIQFTRVEI